MGRAPSVVLHTAVSLSLLSGAAAVLCGPSVAGPPSRLLAHVALDSLGVVLQVGDSLLPSAGRGLFITLDEGVEEAIIPSGTPICGYCDGLLVEQAVGDKAVPFAFGDAQQLVLHDGELKPLQRAITDSGASELWAHSMRRYGPNGEGISVVPDSITRRVLVPMEEAVASQVEAEAAAYEAELAAAQSQGGAPVEGADDRSEGDGVLEIDEEDLDAMELPQLGFEELGQYCNDLAFSKDMIGEEHAVFEYELGVMPASEKAARAGEDPEPSGTLVPSQVVLVTSRDVRLNEPGRSFEVGARYGLQYWRVLQELGQLHAS